MEKHNTAFNKTVDLLHKMQLRENENFGSAGAATLLAIAMYAAAQFIASQFTIPSPCFDANACRAAKIAGDVITFAGDAGAGISGIVGGVCALRAHDASTIKRQIQTAMVGHALQTNNATLLDIAFKQPE